MYFFTIFSPKLLGFFQIEILDEENSQLQDKRGILEKGQLSSREIVKRKAKGRQKQIYLIR